MIAFSCAQCGMKFQVKPEFAGRSSRCPGCKQPLVVPLAEETMGQVPQGEIDGTASSLARAGVDVSVSLPRRGEKPASVPGQSKGQRYAVRSEIARGGMGAVVSAFDCDIRREVAVKFMLDQSDARKRARFVEEAQITGQLEHPNIVPIHELGVDAKKRLFFSMKMVQGRSLKDIVEQLRDHPQQADKEYTLGRRLTILVGICNALAYAHARGVVHRDLKPANIMVGDFGEVYVMDWGLAKIVNVPSGPAAVAPSDVDASAFANFMKSKPGGGTAADSVASSSSSAQSKVSTSGRDEADLTQEGAILGTPVYMPPEQAMGDIAGIDQRSDIYSLGAILYELLTLQAPIEKDGGYLAILQRVALGEIKPPEVRAPGRFIPRELSAIAMKALAKQKQDRYRSAEAFRDDINRYLEGRSVSAKEDTPTEMLVKFVKRNKGFSTGAAMTLLVLLASLVFIGKAWLRAEDALQKADKNYADYQKEQEEKQDRTRKAVPALTVSARQLVNIGRRKEALDQVELTLLYDPKYLDARLLKAGLLIATKDWVAARGELEQYLQQNPKDVDGQKLLDLCVNGKVDDSVVLFALAEVFQRQNVPGLAIPLLQEVEVTVKARQPLATLYQKQIEANWPGLGGSVQLQPNGQLTLSLANYKQVTTLDALKGMRLDVLILQGCPVSDLSPLKGMPLTTLNLTYCPVRDLTPLKGMPLTMLYCWRCPVSDLSPLKGMPLTTLDLQGCPVSDLAPLQGMPLTSLYLSGSRVSDLTSLKGMPLTTLDLQGCPVSDLAPLQGMPLTSLYLSGSRVSDLTSLKGMPLTTLVLAACVQIKDLAPLKGMPLNTLSLQGCFQIKDLTPLKSMPITTLDIHGCGQIKDLTALDGMDLKQVTLTRMNCTREMMNILRRMKKLNTIYDGNTKYPAEEFWKRYDAGEFK